MRRNEKSVAGREGRRVGVAAMVVCCSRWAPPKLRPALEESKQANSYEWQVAPKQIVLTLKTLSRGQHDEWLLGREPFLKVVLCLWNSLPIPINQAHTSTFRCS